MHQSNDPTTFTIIRADEVYVYVRGRLVMKRWLRTRVSATFHVNPSWVEWHRSEPGTAR